MEYLMLNQTCLCCMCLHTFETANDAVNLSCCKAVVENPMRRELLSSVFGSLAIMVFGKDTDFNICQDCDEKIMSLAQFFELCLQSQQFFNQQVKTEVDADHVLEILTSVQSAEYNEDSNDSEEVPLSVIAGCVEKGSNKYQCTECPKSLKNAGNLKKNSSINSCEHCQKRFRTSQKLRKHTSKFHRRIKPTPCPQCRLVYENREALKEHQISVHGKEMFQCLECFQNFDASSFMTHKEEHHKNLYNCDSCDDAFDTHEQWLNHSTKKEVVKGRYFCHCGLSYGKRLRLIEHKAKVHENKDLRRYQCKECDKKFGSRQGYIHHKNVHLGLKPFMCTMCPQAYHHPAGLHQHVRRSHSTSHAPQNKDLRFLCDNCGYPFSRKSHLERHIFRKHTDNVPNRNIPCQICGKSLKDEYGLKKHIQLHSAVKTVKCDQCARMFFKKSAMIAHVNRIHLNLRPFPCTTCPLRFKVKAHLEKHLRTHTGEKPFGCPFCPYHSAEKSNLNKHIKVHTRAVKFGGSLRMCV